MRYDEAHVMQIGYTALEGPSPLFLQAIIHIETEIPVGFLLACVTCSFFGPDLVANDLVLCIEPEYRGKCGMAIKQLTERYKNWARGVGAKRIYLATSTGIEPEHTRLAYEACGFHVIGTIHEA